MKGLSSHGAGMIYASAPGPEHGHEPFSRADVQ
jgi:hypothetical protein